MSSVRSYVHSILLLCIFFFPAPYSPLLHCAGARTSPYNRAVGFLSRVTYTPSPPPAPADVPQPTTVTTRRAAVSSPPPSPPTAPVRRGHRRRRLTRLTDKRKSRVGGGTVPAGRHARCVFRDGERVRVRGVFGSMIKIKYNDYDGHCGRMRVLEGRTHVRVLW